MFFYQFLNQTFGLHLQHSINGSINLEDPQTRSWCFQIDYLGFKKLPLTFEAIHRDGEWDSVCRWVQGLSEGWIPHVHRLGLEEVGKHEGNSSWSRKKSGIFALKESMLYGRFWFPWDSFQIMIRKLHCHLEFVKKGTFVCLLKSPMTLTALYSLKCYDW